MLQQIREKSSGWIATIILGLIIIAMAFFGLESYFQPQNETYVARIEGPAKFLGWGGQVRDITAIEFSRRFEQFRAERRAAEGEAFDAANFDNMDNKRRVLDSLVDEQLLTLAAERDGITVSDEEVFALMKQDPQFMVGESYNPDQYKLFLATSGMTHAQYVASVRADMARRSLPMAIMETAFAPSSEVDELLAMNRQTRDVELLELPTPSLPAEPPTDAELQAWYDAHGALYRTQEEVAIEYVEMNLATMPPIEAPNEATLRARYDERFKQGHYTTVAQRSGAHILVEVAADADVATVAAARAKAEALAAQARVAGADFAALVRENSDDVGSRETGGDIGEIAPSMFLPEALPALEALNSVGDVSEPVRSTSGWHVIRLGAIVPGNVRSFEDVRAELEAEYLATEQERRFSENAARLLDEIYKSPTVLAPAAAALGLTVQQSTPFTRAGGEGIAAIDLVRRAAFADEQRLERRVSDTIEVAPGHVVALRVTEHKPDAAIPFAEARERVFNDYNADRLVKAAQEQADALLARLQAGESLEAIAAEIVRPVTPVAAVTRQGPLPPDVAQAVFAAPAPAEGQRSFGTAALRPDMRVLFAITKVTPGDLSTLDAESRQMNAEQISRLRGMAELQEYVRALRGYYTVTVAEDRL